MIAIPGLVYSCACFVCARAVAIVQWHAYRRRIERDERAMLEGCS